MGYFKGILHGAILGAAAGMLLAPEAGELTRAKLQRALGDAQSRVGGATPKPAPVSRPSNGVPVATPPPGKA